MSKSNGCAQFLIKFCCLVCLLVSSSRGSGPAFDVSAAWQRSAAAAAERELERTHCHANEAASSRHSSSGAQGQDQGRAEQRYRVASHAAAKASFSGRSPCRLHQSEFARISSDVGTCTFSSSSRSEESETCQVRLEKNP